jgi:stage II sporulation protein D
MRAAAMAVTMVAGLVLAGPALAAPAGHAPANAAHSAHAARGGKPAARPVNPAAKQASAASTLYIRGGGFGHGIGMSQYGAYGYALHGWTYQQILAHYYTGTQIGTTNPNQTVRVLLSSGPAAFAGATQIGNKALNPSLTYDVTPLASGQLAVVNQTTHKLLGKFNAPLTATGAEPLSLAGVGTYRGSLEFRPNGSGGVYTVNVVGLDDYVQGVIGAEMPSSWAPQALETQAVAARTYAITTDVNGGFFNLYPDTRSQMYRGVAAETPSTLAAVAATAGQIVTYDGTPAVTYFFASSGGYTENVQDAWPGATPEPWLVGVPDPYDGAGGDPYHSWTRQLSLSGATKDLGGLVKGKLVSIKVTKTGASPRIMAAKVTGTRGSTTVTGAQLENAFGLFSTWASFTTISGAAGSAPASPAVVHDASDLKVITQLQDALASVGQTVPVFAGSVRPAAPGAHVTIEVRGWRGAWHKTGRARLGKGGRFSLTVPRPGVYRTVYQGLDGPSVTVS